MYDLLCMYVYTGKKNKCCAIRAEEAILCIYVYMNVRPSTGEVFTTKITFTATVYTVYTHI